MACWGLASLTDRCRGRGETGKEGSSTVDTAGGHHLEQVAKVTVFSQGHVAIACSQGMPSLPSAVLFPKHIADKDPVEALLLSLL